MGMLEIVAMIAKLPTFLHGYRTILAIAVSVMGATLAWLTGTVIPFSDGEIGLMVFLNNTGEFLTVSGIAAGIGYHRIAKPK